MLLYIASAGEDLDTHFEETSEEPVSSVVEMIDGGIEVVQDKNKLGSMPT